MLLTLMNSTLNIHQLTIRAGHYGSLPRVSVGFSPAVDRTLHQLPSASRRLHPPCQISGSGRELSTAVLVAGIELTEFSELID